MTDGAVSWRSNVVPPFTPPLCAPPQVRAREKAKIWNPGVGGEAARDDHCCCFAHPHKCKQEPEEQTSGNAEPRATPAQVFDGSWSATAVFTVSGEPLGSAFLQGNTARIVPAPQATTPPPATSSIHQPTQEQQQVQKRRYVFVGKPLKGWGRLVSLPDPEPDQPVQKKTTKAMGKTTPAGRRGRKSKRIRLFVEPGAVVGGTEAEEAPTAVCVVDAAHEPCSRS
jgi:hypothetical protein